MTKLDHALSLARMGFHVFPLGERSKLPDIDRYPTRATRDPQQIKRWWTCPVLGFLQARNIGISTTRFDNDKALLVIDVDVRDGKPGEESLLMLELEHGPLPPTLEAITPTGGRHLFYVVENAVKQGANVLGPGLDIRSHGGYVVGVGSETENGVYQWANQTPVRLRA